MKSASRNRRIRLTCEALEDRCVPAGNVTAAIFDNYLQITGDQNANDIRIVGDGNTVQITSGDGTTTINGGSSATLPLRPELVIDLGNGNNRLSVSNMHLHGGLHIRTGVEDDTISLRDVETSLGGGGGSNLISIDSDQGNDVVDLTNLAVQWGSPLGLRVTTGNDDDHVRLGGWQAHNSPCLIDTGRGNDVIEVEYVPVLPGDIGIFPALSITTGNGDDRVRLAGANWGTGPLNLGHLTMNLGNGNDVLTIDAGAQVHADRAQLDGGLGNDSFVGSSLLVSREPLIITDFEEVVP